ncbi:MAG: hypothetical protein K0R24_1618, partial [Gammaproteobacteria bacterium]|nr:hypothetical protein [Gammaproteobacteria bacterium]
MSYPKRDENKPNRDNALFLTNVLRVFTTRWKTYQKSLQESLSDLSSSMRGRQWLHRRVLIIIGVVILVMIACFIFVFDKKPPVRHASSSSEPILIKTDHDSLHTWQVESSETFNALSEAQKKQEKVINSLNEGLNSEKTSIDTLSSQLKDMQLMLEKVSRQRENVVSTAGIAPQRAPAFMNGGEGAYSQNGSNLQSTATFPAMMPRFDKLHEYTPPVEQSIKETKTGNPSVYSRNRKTGWFPTGGFMQST